MLTKVGYKVIKTQHLDFILTPEKIYFQTKLQNNYLTPAEGFWSAHQRYIRALIEMGEIHDFDSLSFHCSYKLKWVPTSTRFVT